MFRGTMIATIIFNESYIGLLNIIKLINITIGDNLQKYCEERDATRIYEAESPIQLAAGDASTSCTEDFSD